jgi:hypothetical protein
MSRISDEQKRIESWFLEMARNAGVPIPYDELPGEKPDFSFQTPNGALGIELAELLRPPSNHSQISPVMEGSIHRRIMETAQKDYYAVPNARPVHINAYFTKKRSTKQSESEMTRALSEFVQINVHRANPAAIFKHENVPDGFDSVLIVSDSDSAWWSGESGGITLSEIRPLVEARIAAKDELVKSYRSNLPDGAELWLLLHTGVTVARSMPIPTGIEAWSVPFQFDRVFWFAALDGQFAEIRKQ